MQYKAFLLAAALSLVLNHTAFAQGPVADEVMVTFDQTVQVGSHSLPAGKYTIRQVTSASNPRVLEFTSKNGTQLDATVAAVPILQNTPPSKTRVILDDEGGTHRLARIWVQGRSYGYEFPAHSGATAANRVGLEGTFVAQGAPAVAPVVAQERTPEPEPAPVAQSAPRADNAVIAQNRPAEAPAPPTSQTQPSDSPAETAPNTTPEVPATALGWIQIALLGMTLASMGGFLYWRERSSR